MKNLHLTTANECDECPLLLECQFLSANNEIGVVYGASQDRIFAFECRENVEIVAEASLKDNGFLDDGGEITAIQYIPDMFCLSVALSNGELILWNYLSSPALENVGTVNGGLRGMCWSHDFELLVLATGNDSMILMTRDFEPIVEGSLNSSQFGEAELVNVGWGKKETQFHGSEGKSAASKKSEGLTQVFDWDDRNVRVTWRGDGQYFAVQYIDAATDSRMFKIWTREGKLHSTSAPSDGLAQAVCFRTQGNLLASSAFQQNEHKVLFFEKNGLQHGEFTVPIAGKNAKIKELSWNLDSTILAVVCDIDESTTQVQLWTTSNYHWYLKQCLQFSGNDKLSCSMWDQEYPLKLHLLTANGRYVNYNWTFAISKSLVISNENDVNVGVIDGARLLVTPFARCVVPPPMSAYNLKVDAPIECVMFGDEERTNDILVSSIDGCLWWFSHLTSGGNSTNDGVVSPDAMGGNGFRVQCPMPTLRAQARFPDVGKTPLALHHLNWIAEDLLVACHVHREVLSIKYFHICWNSGVISERASVEVPSGKQVLATDFNPFLKVLFVELDDGSCYRFNPDEAMLLPWCNSMGEHFLFPRPCQRVSAISFEDKDILIGLTEQFRVFMNGNEVAQDCTSYEIHKNFILLTTHSHTLRSLQFRDFLSDNASLSTNETTRVLERGSKLVCLVPRDTKVVLQMPRGNLEVIHPRSLLMEAIQRNIESMNYKQAFELCRKHRVNMNILIDHNIANFIQRASVVVQQLESSHNLNLLLSDLQEEDYTKTMYSSYYKNKVGEVVQVTKVEAICNCFVDELKLKDEKKYFHSILMTHLKRATPDIEGALVEVKRMKDSLQDGLKFTDDALKFLMYLVDVNVLYDVAMGTYDLKLVLLVAEKSQKDPKEYLPYLNKLRKMSSDLMKYTIDMKLKKYSKALVHVSRLGKDHFEDCMKLIGEQKLYPEALVLYKTDSDEYKEIAMAYAEHLSEQRHYNEAGLMYFKAGEFGGALKMLEEAKNWRLAFCCASKLNFSHAQVVELARKLSGLLIDSHQYLDAGFILENYADDYEEAVVALISGRNWDEALRIIYRHKRTDLLEVNLKPSLASSADNFSELIGRTHDEFSTHRDRLIEVRKVKEMQSDLMEDGGDARQNCDLYSDASSIADGDSVASSSAASTDSRSSRKTGKSSKSRQKLARKKWSLRKGGPTEEFALIEVLHKMATMVNGWKVEMGVLLRTLVLFNEEAKAKNLQKKLESIIDLIDLSIPLVWSGRNSNANNDSDVTFGPHMSTNLIIQLRSNVNNSTPMPTDPILVTPPTFDKKDAAWKLILLEKMKEF